MVYVILYRPKRTKIGTIYIYEVGCFLCLFVYECVSLLVARYAQKFRHNGQHAAQVGEVR